MNTGNYYTTQVALNDYCIQPLQCIFVSKLKWIHLLSQYHVSLLLATVSSPKETVKNTEELLAVLDDNSWYFVQL